MAISINSFDKGNFKKRVHSRKEHPVYQFLIKNQEQAFTVKEIEKQIKMKPETIRSMLRELIEENLISHKTPYWAIKHRKRK